jgi:hypothetical protein
MKNELLTATSALAALFAMSSSRPAEANTLIATVYGFYDAEAGIADLPSSVTSNPSTPGQYDSQGVYDTPSLFFVNPTGYAIDNAQMVLSVSTAQNNGQNTLNNGVSQTVSLGTLGANGITQVAWGTGGPLFADDYDDDYNTNYGAGITGNSGSALADCTLTYGASAPDPQWQNFCAPIGNFKVSFSGTLSGVGALNGQSIAAVFAEYGVNDSYTGWEGVDPNGWSENASYDVHSGTVSGVLANIYLGNVGSVPSSPSHGVPEPATMSLLGAGLGALALARRRRTT